MSYNSTLVFLKKDVSPHRNNYIGELVGIQISLQILAEIDKLRGRNIRFFTDCQAAILTAFHNQLPMTKIEITMDIKQLISEIMEKDNMIHVHWVPAHKDIMENELSQINRRRRLLMRCKFLNGGFNKFPRTF